MTGVSFVTQVVSPIFWIFAIIAAGYGLGKARVAGISLGLAGVLIVAIAFGFLSARLPQIHLGGVYITLDIGANIQPLSSIGSALFLSSIGLSAGYLIPSYKWRLLQFLLAGIVMVLTTFFVARGILWLDPSIDANLLYGIFCGAMTSTPGLMALCESDNGSAPLGYSIAYLFGLMATVLWIQIQAKDIKMPIGEKELTTFHTHNTSNSLHSFFVVARVTLFGCVLGAITLPIVRISLGNTGGILIAGLLEGFFDSHNNRTERVSAYQLSLLRNFGLLLFFVGTGVQAGMQITTDLRFLYMVYSCLLAVFPLCVGCVLSCKLSGGLDCRLSLLAGGMTSTPAYGILAERGYARSPAFTLAYIGALLTIVFLMRQV